MRTTLILNGELLSEARRLTGIEEKTGLIHEALRALIARASAQRLAALGGSEPNLRAVPRKRSKRSSGASSTHAARRRARATGRRA